jgi:predicted dehydrogenase
VSGEPVKVALVGASGHGLWHRRQIAPLHDEGVLRLVALVDVRPVEPAPDAPVPRTTGVFTDHREMLATARPDVVVICTPPHTHLAIAVDALRAGCDVLLEKPPVLSLAEHDALAAALAGTGLACQVGFQALGSAALGEFTAALVEGRVGTVTGISTVASWRRDDAYYGRSPWAGRRTVNGRPSLDGAIANPLAHALMHALAVAATLDAGDAAAPRLVELERYRTRSTIDVDDTASLRLTLPSGRPVVMAVTLCGEDFIPGEVIVQGTAGRAVLEYPTDRLLLPGDTGLREVPGRASLLGNLLDHRADRSVPLIAPLSRTLPFTVVLEAVGAAPDPVLLDRRWYEQVGAPPARMHVIGGVNATLRAAADRMALLSELSTVPWAVPPHVVAPGAGRVAHA